MIRPYRYRSLVRVPLRYRIRYRWQRLRLGRRGRELEAAFTRDMDDLILRGIGPRPPAP